MKDKISKLKNIIKNENNIVFFGGAGVSTESNIPDFRSEKGLYNAVNKYGFPPEKIISHSFFKTNTEIFYKYYKENLIYQKAEPNIAHIKLAQLEKDNKLKAVITQNIDNLHQKAGSKNVLELHGNVYRNYCTYCNEAYNLDYILNNKNCIDKNGNQTSIPFCKKCKNIVKPDVVLYEEALNEDIISQTIKAIMSANTLIIGGTSLSVYPAASLIKYFSGENLILINKSQTQYDDIANLIFNTSIGEVLGQI